MCRVSFIAGGIRPEISSARAVAIMSKISIVHNVLGMQLSTFAIVIPIERFSLSLFLTTTRSLALTAVSLSMMRYVHL